MKIITSSELQNWAATRESQEKLPLLIRKLIINNIGFNNIQFIDIPGGDSIWKPGSDGKLSTTVDSLLGPANTLYIIECGQNANTEYKFKTDLIKRTKELQNKNINPIFIFITTHKLKNKQKNIQTIKSTIPNINLWKDIKIFDADDIETWLDYDYATQAWFADIIGKPIDNIKSFDMIWAEWIKSTCIPIDEDLILARTYVHQQEINKWLLNPAHILKIKSNSKKESLLFLFSCIIKSDYNNEIKESIKSQIVVIESKEQWNIISQYKESKNLILIPFFGIPENLGSLFHNKYKIFLPMGPTDGTIDEENILLLEPYNTHILYNKMMEKIKSADIVNKVIESLGKSGTLLHLQRILKSKEAPLPSPQWCNEENAGILLTVALIGGWNEKNKMDTKAVEKLFNIPYEQVSKILFSFTNMEEYPIKKIGDRWEVINPNIIINLLGYYLTKEFIINYINISQNILSLTNPIYDSKLSYSFSIAFDFKNKKHTYYSDILIKGIANSYNLLGNKNFPNITQDIKTVLSNAINTIFTNKSWKTWATLEPILPAIAESSPRTFLKILKNTINNRPDTIKEIYKHSITSDIYLFNRYLYCGLLSALEILAWSEKYFIDTVYLLIKLEELRDVELSTINSPLNSLFSIFCPWYSNTSVSIDNKKMVIENLCKENMNKEIIFNMVYSLLFQDHQLCTPTNKPKFYDNKDDKEIKTEELNNFNKFIFKRSLDLLDLQESRWKKIINYASSSDSFYFNLLYDKMNKISWNKINKDFSNAILQDLLHWKNYWQYDKFKSKENNSAIKDRFNKVNVLIQKIGITDPINNNISLFSHRITENYLKETFKPIPVLQEAIKEIFNYAGWEGIIDFSKKINTPNVLGKELVYFCKDNNDALQILNTDKRNESNVKTMLLNFFNIYFHTHNAKALDYVYDTSWEESYKISLLCSINMKKEYWEWINDKGLSDLYWPNISNLILEKDEEYDIVFKNLKKYNNYSEMIRLMIRQIYSKKSDLIKTSEILDVLYGILNKKIVINYDLSVYYIKKLFELLDQRDDVEVMQKIFLEIAYFDIFNNNRNISNLTLYKQFGKKPDLFILLIQEINLSKNNCSETDMERNKQIQKVLHRISNSFPFESKEECSNWITFVISLIHKDKFNKDIRNYILQIIGNIIANAPTDPKDSIWPILYIREIIEKIYSDDLKIKIAIGKFNLVGVRLVDPNDPGGYFFNLSKSFRKNSEQITLQYPRTAEILEYIAADYEWHGNMEKNRY